MAGLIVSRLYYIISRQAAFFSSTVSLPSEIGQGIGEVRSEGAWSGRAGKPGRPEYHKQGRASQQRYGKTCRGIQFSREIVVNFFPLQNGGYYEYEFFS